jgi:SAM-dependent methyltransferase
MRKNTDQFAHQQAHWDRSFDQRSAMFGRTASHPALYAADLFEQEGCRAIIELGAGQGRDTLYFARRGFHVTALDYSHSGLEALEKEAEQRGVASAITAVRHDVKQPLPFANEAYDACYSHMLYCMALSNEELETLSQETRRVLKPGGLNIYSVRNTNDADYGRGPCWGEDMYESNGFVVHFFSTDKVVQLSKGYELVALEEFEEGSLPRKLFLVTLRKLQEASSGS